MVKVLILGSKEFPIGTSNDSIRSGGMEYDIDRLAPIFAGRNIKVHVITRKFDGTKEYEKVGKISIHRVPWLRGRYARNYSFNFFSFLKALKVIQKNNIKVVHSVGVVASFTAVILKYLTNVKVFAEPRGCQLRTWHFPFNLLLGLQERLVYPLCDKVGFQSEEQAKSFEQVFNMRLDNKVIVPTGIELNVKTNPKKIRKEFDLNGKFVVTFVGRIEKVKGVEYLIQAMKLLTDDFKLLVVGTGSEEKALRISSLASPLYRRVRFTGWRDDIRDILAASNAFILPSLSEGVPTALLEAMAEGVPCITTVGGFLVYHIEPRSPEQIAEAIHKLKKSRKLAKRLALLGRKYVRENYALEDSVKKYVYLYDQLAIKTYNTN